MTKRSKITIAIVVCLAVGVVGYFINEMCGNPISKAMATKTVQSYLDKNYADDNLKIKNVCYNFKFSEYYAEIVSDTSIDTKFDVYVTKLGNKVKSDTYQAVESGWVTYSRIEKEYREMVEAVFDAPDFPFTSNIDFGTIEELHKSESNPDVEYGVDLKSLVKDKQYDIREIAKSAGHIIYYVTDPTVTVERASEILLQMKQILDDANIPFYAIDLVLEEPGEDEKPNFDGPCIDVDDFLYTDIYEEDLCSRVEKANDMLNAYYNEKDAERDGQINAAN